MSNKTAMTSTHTPPGPAARGWSYLDLFAFRVVFLFFILTTLPLDGWFYRTLFTGSWIRLRFQDLFAFVNRAPFPIGPDAVGKASFAGLGIALVLAIAGAAAWTFADRRHRGYRDYAGLYYWLRVWLRYRLALVMIAYGFLKLFPLQLPYPTLSDLNTEYGYFLKWKIYYLSNGIASAHYIQSLGLLEVLGGLLLLYRKTVVVGSGILAVLLSNIVMVNFAYGIGTAAYPIWLLLLALFLLSYDVPRLYRLLCLGQKALADKYIPLIPGRVKRWKSIAQLLVLGFILAYGVSVGVSYSRSNWPFSDAPGLRGRSGLYNVSSFRVDSAIVPYSTTDTTRWQDVVLETWNTISIRINRPVHPDPNLPVIQYLPDDARDYEQAGNGGRHFYIYLADTVRQTLTLHNKQEAQDSLVFHYDLPDSATIALDGITVKGDSLHITLNRINKRYFLREGTRKPLKI